MREIDDLNSSSTSQARSALITASALSLAGTGVGIYAMTSGNVDHAESVLILSGLPVSVWALTTLIAFRRVRVQTVATVCTISYAIYLCAGMLVSLLCRGNHQNLFVYLFWLFTLLVFNKLVNEPSTGRFLARFILIAPLIITAGLFRRVLVLFPQGKAYLVVVFCLSFLCFGLMLEAVTRYREQYIIESERADSLRVKSEVLESISDCFIALDAEMRLVYLNDAACLEFGAHRVDALHRSLQEAIPDFSSLPMMAELASAFRQPTSAAFEVQDGRGYWYEMRCFPQLDRMSVHFRNTTESMLARRRLEAAQDRLRDQAELLDKAQDAILVQDLDSRILYWNQGAERLFGWTSSEVLGLRLGDVFQTSAAEERLAFSAVLELGNWTGELAKKNRDGRFLIVESRSTLVRDKEGAPRSILAINTDVTARKAADDRIQNLAFHDVLTGLPNRALLRERLEKALAAGTGRHTRSVLMLIDLDDFKTLNDTSGHDVGDRLLCEVAIRLSTGIRASDTAARLGGDEFVVLLENLNADAETALAQAKKIGESIVRACRMPYVLAHQEYEGTASMGATLLEAEMDTVDDLLKRADLAMYQAKAQGRNSLCFFDPAMAAEAESRASLLADMKRALQNDEFELHYQPQVDGVGQVTGCEALLRWPHARRGMVSPGEFIPLAEADGMIVELGYWVLDTACERLAGWAWQPEMRDMTMAVNVSIRQFLDSRFVERVESSLRESGANPRKLKLEITESFMMDRVDDVIAKMLALKEHGICFSMDDFGTGYSSLSQLKRLPLDQLKIDQSFVRDVLSGVTDASIVHTIIALGRSLGLAVIAEGVETDGQREFLKEHGCHAYQGYLFSPSLRAAEFEAYAAKSNSRNEQDAA